MTDSTVHVDVSDDPEHERYVVTADGRPVGLTAYRAKPGLIAFIHTEVDEDMEGQGLASKLIGFALDDARRKGMAVLPFCPFVNDFIHRHPEYADLVPASQRGEFGL